MMKLESGIQLTDEQFKDMVLLLLSELLDRHYQNKHTDHEYYDSADVKQLLKISDRTLQRLRKSDEIPHIRIGKKIFYPKSFFTEASKNLRKD
ncbi:helix-turn-helix domain-containing protein [Chryseobacterium aquaticum]|nr:helix-turn-helix domain-containing protein [Chryseobacterium aquaticum]